MVFPLETTINYSCECYIHVSTFYLFFVLPKMEASNLNVFLMGSIKFLFLFLFMQHEREAFNVGALTNAAAGERVFVNGNF